MPTMNAKERRRAWRMYAANALANAEIASYGNGCAARGAACIADRMLAEEDKRFEPKGGEP